MSRMKWARLQADVNVQLRRGAWYRVKELGPLETVLEVRGKPLLVPSAFIQVAEQPPHRWTVVPSPKDAVRFPEDWGAVYAVCPSCRERAQLHGRPSSMHCPRCKREFDVAWDEAYEPDL